MDEFTVVRPGQRSEGDATRGIARERLFETDVAVMIQATVEPDVTSGWHHHGDRHTFGYTLSGRTVTEFGPDGGGPREVTAGECYYIPPGVVHRGRNPDAVPAVFIETVVGSGPLVVNVSPDDR